MAVERGKIKMRKKVSKKDKRKKPFIYHLRLQSKLILGLVMMALLLMVLLVPILASIYQKRMEEHFTNLVLNQATAATLLIDGDKIQTYNETNQIDHYYEEIEKYLSTSQQQLNLKSFYVIIPQENEIVYIWKAGEETSSLGDRESYDKETKDVIASALENGKSMVVWSENNESHHSIASGYVTILDSQGKPAGLVGVDISLEKINNQVNYLIRTTFLVILAVLVISVFVYYFYVRRILMKPLDILYESTQKIGKENLNSLQNFSIDIHTHDELENLGESFCFMTKQLQEYMENFAQVTVEKERIEAELDIAAKIQSDMLPNHFPLFPERFEFDVFASMTPAKEVGGDFYDLFLVDDDHLALVIADVSGKGVPAALFMMTSKTLLKNALQSKLPIKNVLETVNNQLCENNKSEMFVTVWIGLYEISSGKLIAANAGHEYPALRKSNGKFELIKDRHGLVLGGIENIKYREYELLLKPGDTLFVYTDGVVEATEANLELYGSDRMLEALNQDPNATPQTLLENVHKSIKQFTQEMAQFDDITMLCLKRLSLEKRTEEEKNEKTSSSPKYR